MHCAKDTRLSVAVWERYVQISTLGGVDALGSGNMKHPSAAHDNVRAGCIEGSTWHGMYDR